MDGIEAAIIELERAKSFMEVTKAKDAKISKNTILLALESLKETANNDDDGK